MAANDHEFAGSARERNRDYARGWNGTPGTLPRGGITWPDEVKIRKGTVLIRVGHSRDAQGRPIPDWINLTSPWWMESGTFLDLAARGEDAGTDIVQMVRMKLALTPDFGVADTLFRVVTRQPLRAWNGRARPVLEDPDPAVRAAQGRPMAWLGGYEVAQNFIPGLRDFARQRPTDLALASLAVLPSLPLSAYATIRNGGFGLVPWPWPA